MLYDAMPLTPRQEAVILLLAEPDPPELPRRAHVYRWPKAVNSDQRKQELLLRWLQWREMQVEDWEDAREQL